VLHVLSPDAPVIGAHPIVDSNDSLIAQILPCLVSRCPPKQCAARERSDFDQLTIVLRGQSSAVAAGAWQVSNVTVIADVTAGLNASASMVHVSDWHRTRVKASNADKDNDEMRRHSCHHQEGKLQPAQLACNLGFALSSCTYPAHVNSHNQEHQVSMRGRLWRR
jgi:hypothetical protein